MCALVLRTQELDLLEEDASVFKLIGPVLVKQELMEVKNNVTKRVEFIKSDMCAPAPRAEPAADVTARVPSDRRDVHARAQQAAGGQH